MLFERSLALPGSVRPGGLATSNAGLGEAQSGLHRLEPACENLERALRIAIEIEFVPVVFAALIGAGFLLLKLDHPEDGLRMLALVRDHPASSTEVKQRAERYLLRSQTQTPVEYVHKAAEDTPDVVWQEARKVLVILAKARASGAIHQADSLPSEQAPARPDPEQSSQFSTA
jgi:hypothetical protein